jgi:uncharacterized protein
MRRAVLRSLMRSAPHQVGAWVRVPPGNGRRVLVTGGTGFIGTPLVATLRRHGYEVTALTRQPERNRQRLAAGVRLIAALEQLTPQEQIDVVINLAGESLNSGRWSERRKKRLFESRIETTQSLYTQIARLERMPALLINGSAVGYYGPHGDQALDESAPGVPSFSHDLCARWEQEALRFESLGLRVCRARFGVVLGRAGGPLRELLKSYAFGAAVVLGSGEQWLSWIHLDELIAVLGFLIAREDLSGAFNCVAPEPVTNAELADTLRRIVRAPIRLRIPAATLRLLVGGMADELLLAGQRVVPARLLAAGYEFRMATLEDALRDILDGAGHTGQM